MCLRANVTIEASVWASVEPPETLKVEKCKVVVQYPSFSPFLFEIRREFLVVRGPIIPRRNDLLI